MAPSNQPSNVDVIQNKLNMLFASQQRLLQTWLPPRTAEEVAQQKSAEELKREEEALFRPMPTNLGVGAPLPKDLSETDSAVRRLTADDRLRKKLLGGRVAASTQAKAKPGTAKVAGQEQKPPSRRQDVEPEDEEEEAGRSALGRSKRSKRKGPSPAAASDDDNPAVEKNVTPRHVDKGDESTRSSRPAKRVSTFLDVMLAEKSRGKRRKG